MTKKLSISVAALAFGLFALGASLPAQTQAATTAGDLIKCADFSAVYYLAEDNRRHVFPSDKIYFSYYEDFDGVKTISCEDLAGFPLGGNIPYRAGTRLVKLVTVPVVYAVEPDGVLRPIDSESQAIKLYGDDWADRVDDLSDAFFPAYTLGDTLADDEIPVGTVLERDSGDVYSFGSDRLAVHLGDASDAARDYPILFRHRTQATELTSESGQVTFDDTPSNDALTDLRDRDIPVFVDVNDRESVDSVPEVGEDTGTDDAPNDVTVDMTSGNFFFTPSTIMVDSGAELTVNFAENLGTHTFTIDELEVNDFITEGESMTFTVDLPPGEYAYYCDVGTHRELGMEGVLIVK